MSDQAARQLAVEPGRSVIVQAPAGSGKTSLLVERYLALLATVDEPEAILAITFTRKAAAEMRERVLQFLDPAFVAEKPHEKAAKARAEAVEAKVQAWGLRENPQRLMIRTIDSFNQFLARAMPVASQLGPMPSPAEHTQALYREAARRILARLNDEEALSEDLARLLKWRDHRTQDIEALLMSLLGQREQWLRAIGRIEPVEQAAFEATLHDLVSEQLRRASTALQQALAQAGMSEQALLAVLSEAAACAADLAKPTPFADWSDYRRLPAPNPAELDGWRMLGFALLTNGGTWRASLNKNYGFPPKSEHKAAMEALLEQWTGNEELADLLHQARELPVPEFGPGEWPVLAALIRVLKQAAAELDLLFAERGKSDFAALGDAAQRGLGNEEDGYSDLALYLDQRIDHILVDEYQDTNWGQFHLLEKLVAGWAGEGEQQSHRSLFLVGDPMQSIYRFREAEVGLFMRTRDQGIGAQTLESAQLTRNFRSRAEIVEWVNERIGPAFPSIENMAAGAVRYAPSEPAREPGGRVEVLAEIDRVQEAEALAARIRDTLEANQGKDDFKAAVIVRARSHLSELLPALARHGVRYRAVKLDPLLQRPVAQDLLSITRLVIDPAHPSARLALLRSPLCGLSLKALHALAGDGKDPLDDDALDRLSPEDRERAEPVYAGIEAAYGLRGRRSVRDRVEGLFLRLGGPQILCARPTEQRDAQRFLDVLAQAEDEGLLNDWNAFLALLDEQTTEGDPPDDEVRLEVLTMHGAKGLEWDAVFLPGLDRPPRGASQELLYWLPITPESGEEQVLLAPLRSAEQASNTALIQFINNQRKQREAYEQQRLLYVAATRAKEFLCLSAVLDPDKQAQKPAAGSLLASLWPNCEGEFLRAFSEALERIPELGPDSDDVVFPAPRRQRVQSGWRPSFEATLDWTPALPVRERSVEIEFSWQNTQARRIGTVLHRILEDIGRVGLERFDEVRLARLESRIPGLLQAMGTGRAELQASVEVIEQALDRTLSSETGRWILSGEHPEHACELALSGLIDGKLVNAVIDRTFVDAQGVRWIIDYKSGHAEDERIEEFLQHEAEEYRDQLSVYRRLFEQMGETDVRIALYLPRLDRLEEL
ncbi:UvrD-helicase domain-containing protein [Wenzhouxiangella marina]|uniref:DNA 3'-5' helicase n=1 Tax=Wenzhouxiangella marina TaxID=1579979 RepID=A0A0K0XV46_9GAMM|nr:UvrD-helicase domain-containing protein [Wenzhouxiangella marina]AKS41497.1 ATP-dependent nuclease subunit A [Wenzhouxiangella marina]MBB6086744.1 ATP-dependent exoDNAse (exonuclease V) beta subunit [Wenzhouxiangella marina]